MPQMRLHRENDPRLRRALNAIGRGKHSELYLWMRHHHSALKANFKEKGPSWQALVVVFAEEGLTDAAGNPPTLRTAQQTWYRVCREVEKGRRGQADGNVPTRRQTRQKDAPSEPEGSTLPDAVQHPSGVPPLERLQALAAARASGFATGPRRALRMPTLGGSAPAAEASGAGQGMALERPAMPKPRLIHKQGENGNGET